MPYPGSFHRLVMIGDIYTDTWNMTLSIAPVSGTGTLDLGAVGPTDLAAIAAVVGAWFPLDVPNGPGITARCNLRSIKLNRIGDDGKYADATSREHVYGTPIVGGGGSVNIAAQDATVATLETAIPRGRGSKGRIFLPPGPCNSQAVIGTDGRATAAIALSLAGGVKKLIDDLNTAYVGLQTGDEKLGKVSVASNAGSGSFRPVTAVRVGRVPDTMRSRRSKLVEDYQRVTIA